jgi:hypothetical protein
MRHEGTDRFSLEQASTVKQWLVQKQQELEQVQRQIEGVLEQVSI